MFTPGKGRTEFRTSSDSSDEIRTISLSLKSNFRRQISEDKS